MNITTLSAGQSRKKSNYTFYHKICDSIDESLLSVKIDKMSHSEVLTYYKKLLEVKRKAQLCAMLREKHRNLFYTEDQWNAGHTKAIDIKKRLVQSCDKKLIEIAYRIAELTNLNRTFSSSSSSNSNSAIESVRVKETPKDKAQKKQNKKVKAIEAYASQWLEDNKTSEAALLKQYVEKTNKQMANEVRKQIGILFNENPIAEMSALYGDKALMKCADYLKALIKKHDNDAKVPFIIIIHWINMRRQMTKEGLGEVMEFVKKTNPETVIKSIENLQSSLIVLDDDHRSFFTPNTKYFYYVIKLYESRYKCVSRVDITVQKAISLFLSLVPAISRENAGARRYIIKNFVTLAELSDDKNMMLRKVSDKPLPIFTIKTTDHHVTEELAALPAALKSYYGEYILENVFWFAFNNKYFDIISILLHTHENAAQVANILTDYVHNLVLDDGLFIMINALCSLLKYEDAKNKENLMKSKNLHDIVGIFARAKNKLPQCFQRVATRKPTSSGSRIKVPTNERLVIENKEYIVYLGKRGAKYVKRRGKFISVKKL